MHAFKITVTRKAEDEEGQEGVKTTIYFESYETAMDATMEANEVFPNALKIEVEVLKEE